MWGRQDWAAVGSEILTEGSGDGTQVAVAWQDRSNGLRQIHGDAHGDRKHRG